MPQSFPLTPATNPTSRSARRLAFLLIPLALQFAHADSATWNLNPTNGDWYTAANWTPNTVPNGPGDIATFDVSTITDISPVPGTGSIEVDSIVFNLGASAYTITVPWYLGEFNYFLYISGTGIVNNSGVSQNFVNLEGDGVVFENNATAGNLTVFWNPAGPNPDGFGGRTVFGDGSNAGSGTFINGGAEGVVGGLTAHSTGSRPLLPEIVRLPDNLVRLADYPARSCLEDRRSALIPAPPTSWIVSGPLALSVTAPTLIPDALTLRTTTPDTASAEEVPVAPPRCRPALLRWPLPRLLP